MRRIIAYVTGFGIARGALFAAPIVLANLLPVELYGRLELAQSMAVLGALVFGLGLPASVPLALLRDEVRARWDTLLFLLAGLAIVLLIISAGNALVLSSATALPVLVPLAMAILLLQGLWANSLKSHGKGTGAVLLEAGFWITAVLGGVIIAAGVGGSWTLAVALSGYAALLLALTIRACLDARTAFGPADLLENVKVSVPLMMVGLLSVLVSSSGRIILGYTSTVEIMGLYAIIFRATALPIVGHQLLIVGLFRALYTWDVATLKRRALIIPVGVSVLAFGFWLVVDHMGFLLGPRFAETFPRFRVPALLILAQTVLWSAISLNDLLNSRLLIAGRVARYLAAYLILALPALALVTAHGNAGGQPATTLLTFAIWHSALMFGYYLTQCLAIWRAGHRYPLLWASALTGYVVLVVFFLAGELV